MFEKTRPLNAREYIRLKEWQKKNSIWNNLTTKQKSVVIGTTVALGCFVLGALVVFRLTVEPSNGISLFGSWASMSWASLLKIGFCVMLISWVFHGVQIKLFA